MPTNPTQEASAELKAAAQWIMEMNDRFNTFDEHFGEFEAVFSEGTQTLEWHCWGCDGVGYSKWPEWELEFAHNKDCKYIKAKEAFYLASQ